MNSSRQYISFFLCMDLSEIFKSVLLRFFTICIIKGDFCIFFFFFFFDLNNYWTVLELLNALNFDYAEIFSCRAIAKNQCSHTGLQKRTFFEIGSQVSKPNLYLAYLTEIGVKNRKSTAVVALSVYCYNFWMFLNSLAHLKPDLLI